MREHVKSLLQAALDAAKAAGELEFDGAPEIVINRNRDPEHGDFACPMAMALAKLARRKPRDIAEILRAHLPASNLVAKVEIAGPGFINVFLADAGLSSGWLARFDSAGALYGRAERRLGDTVQVEFVSANPTGPLHVGHGRGAAYGDAVCVVTGCGRL